MDAVENNRLLRALGAAVSPLEDAAAGLALRDGEWREFARLAVRHRVTPLVARPAVLGRLPDDARQTIETEARQNAIRTLALTHALRTVLDRLGEIGVSPVVLKGPPLAEHLYGAADLRDTGDLDLLIDPEAIANCVEVLASLGFRVHPVHGTRQRVLASRALLDECNDLALRHPVTGIAVELHWRPHHFRGWPDLLSGGREVECRAGEAGETLVPSDRANLVYLSLHGTLHLWRRLKWLADIAWLAHRRGAAALADDLDFARAAGAFDAVATGLRLADKVIGCPLPAAIDRPETSRRERRMLAGIVNHAGEEDGLRFRLGTYVAAFGVAQGSRQKLGVVRYGLWRPLRLMAVGLGR